MWKQQKTSNFIQQLTLTFVITVIFWDTALGLSDKRLCADENCKKLISVGKGMINYPAGQEGMVSFKVNANIRVKSKSAGSDPSLWGIEVNGREGYAPKRFIKEEKIFVNEKDLNYTVDVVKPGVKMSELSQTSVLNSSEILIETTKTEQKPNLSPAPVLNTSEIVIETTTTQALEAINKDEAIVSSPVESHEQPQNASPVQHDTIIEVEGTKLPTLNESYSEKEKVNLQKVSEASSMAVLEYDDDDDDGGIGDYDEEEGEGEGEGEGEQIEKNQKVVVGTTLEEEATKKATPLSSNVNTNETKQLEPLTNKVETIGMQTSTENSKQHTEGEEIDKKTQKDSVGTTLEEEATNKATPLSSNLNTSEPNVPDPLNNKVETIEMQTSTENSKQQNLSENGNATAKEKSTENSQQDALKHKDIQEAVTATPLENVSKLIEANMGVQVLNESSEITKTTEKIPTGADLYNDVTNNSLTESTNIFDNKENSKESVESTRKTDGAKEAFERAIIADEPNPSVPNKTEEVKSNEEISFNATNNEALPTASVEENVVENHISKQSSLPNNKINVDVITEAPPIVNNVEVIPNTEENSRVEESSNEPTEAPSTHLPIDTTTEVVGETDNVQVNTNQYSSPAAETNNTQTSNESVPSQQTTVQDSQLSMETSIKDQKEHSESHASKNLPFDSHNPTNGQTQLPQPQSPQHDHPPENPNEYYTGSRYNPYDYDESSNTPLPPQYDNNNNNNNPNDLPQTTDIPPNGYYGQQPITHTATVDLEPEVTTENPVLARTPEDSSSSNQPSFGQGSVEPVQRLDTPTESPKQEEDPKSLPSLTPPVSVVDLDRKETKGLFATIMDTVNNILPNNKKPKPVGHNQLDRILYSTKDTTQPKGEDDTLFCEKLDPDNCPHSSINTPLNSGECECSFKTLVTTEFTLERFLQVLAAKILEISELIAFLAIVAATSLFFIFGYYCFCNSSNEGALLSKLNQLESCLLASHKENAILKHNLMSTRQKLASIEDNSFGSNDMVVSLKKELEEELLEKARLQEQIVTLQKELENAADAGIELNKIVSELLSNQTGDESIISSVEELQKQLNEQQNTILEINASLAEKSRENSELQLMIAEQNARYDTQISDLQQDNDELEAEKANLQSRLEEIRTDFDKDITAALESKNFEIKRLQNEIIELSDNVENGHTKWQTSMAKVEALEECLRNVKRDPNVNINHVIDVAHIRAELLDAQKKFNGLKERWEHELDARKLAENQLQSATAEVEKIKQDFNQTEKDKLEAQTRLEVLSNYFKDKENQLQKELSLKETMWLKQQGETTTTVDRLTTMQEEIQSLKSQNDSLRAEIEAQVAAHKAQTGTLENRAHETWLAARQSDRRYEEVRAEATALRRKLTALAGGSINEVNKTATGPAGLGDDLANASSPIHMESPGSPMLGRMPPPPFLPPPFMGPPPPFMGLPPPPPFVPTGEMRPAPLGRIMSPPPPQRSGHMDYEDYLDYEGNSSWHRHHTYSPPPRTYRSLSPTDSRYNYSAERDLISRYDTETDFSPPPSPRESRRRGGGGGGGYGSDKEDNNTRHPYNNSKKSSSGSKAPISSGSDKSYNSSSKKGNKSKSGGGGGGGKFLV